MRHITWLCALCLIVVGSGCGTDHIRWKTDIDADGKITRTVHLPVSRIPADCTNPALWNQSGYTDKSSENSAELDVGVLELSPVPKRDDNELKHFAARGTFDSVDQIPTHYRIPLGETSTVSKNQVKLQINDYLVFKEYVWTEALTETVKLRHVPQARRDLVAMLAWLTRETLDQGLDEVYDSSALIAWMETEGDRWLEEIYGVYLGAALEQTKPEELEAEIGAVCLRYGLEDLTSEEVRRFIENLLRAKLQRRDGLPVEEEVVASIVTLSGLSLKREGEPDSPLDAVLKQVILEQYETQEAARDLMFLQLSKLVGIHGIPLFMPPEEFQVSLNMPGRLVETNATIRGDGELRWTFNGEQLAPFGFEMSCRSIVSDPESQKQVLARQSPLTSERIDRILELLSLDDDLRQVMIDCGKQQSLDPLNTYREQFVEKTAEGESVTADERAERATELWKILTTSDDAGGLSAVSSSLFGGKTSKSFGILFVFILLVSLLAFSGKQTHRSTMNQS